MRNEKWWPISHRLLIFLIIFWIINLYIVFNLSVGFRLIQVIRTVVAFLFKFFFLSVFFFDGPKMLSHAAQHIFIFWFILKYGGLLWLKFTAVTKIRKYFDTYLYEYWNILTHNVTRNSPFNRKIKHLDLTPDSEHSDIIK